MRKSVETAVTRQRPRDAESRTASPTTAAAAHRPGPSAATVRDCLEQFQPADPPSLFSQRLVPHY